MSSLKPQDIGYFFGNIKFLTLTWIRFRDPSGHVMDWIRCLIHWLDSPVCTHCLLDDTKLSYFGPRNHWVKKPGEYSRWGRSRISLSTTESNWSPVGTCKVPSDEDGDVVDDNLNPVTQVAAIDIASNIHLDMSSKGLGWRIQSEIPELCPLTGRG